MASYYFMWCLLFPSFLYIFYIFLVSDCGGSRAGWVGYELRDRFDLIDHKNVVDDE